MKNKALIQAMGNLKEELLFEELKSDVEAGRDHGEIVADLQEGMDIVGELFSQKTYFLSELILSADLFREAQELMGDEGGEEDKEYLGTFVMGTVATDIHDIGKNIVVSVMRSNGFRVIDLGIDVPKERFVEAIEAYQPEIVGMSCLLTTAFNSMRDTVKAIRDSGLDGNRLLLIGGGPCDENTLKYVNGDGLCKTAQDTVNQSKKFLKEKIA